MKVKKEIQQLRKIQQLMEDNVYPGYPYMIHGIVDMEDKCGWIGLGGRKMNLEKFCHEINAELCYQLIGSTKATKGSWIVDTHMEEHEQYLKAEYNDFYNDNVEVAKLYFALYAAIRESKGTNNIIFFTYYGYAIYVMRPFVGNNYQRK